jgi:hypothetical protein
MAATIGAELDRAIARVQVASVYDAVVLDAVADAAIERLCDFAQARAGLGSAARFSPGYGDLPLSIQPEFLTVVNARMIGLTCTDANILLPRKSVTAVVGLAARGGGGDYDACGGCLLRDGCRLKKSGKKCRRN